MGWDRYQTIEPHPPSPPKKRKGKKRKEKEREHQVGRGLCPSTNSSTQISIFRTRQIFKISYFLQFNLTFEKKTYPSFHLPKVTQKFCTKPQNIENIG